MKTHTLQLPPLPPDLTEHDLKMTLAGALYSQGVVSMGKAAALAGISKRDFILSVGQYGVSIFGSVADIEQDFTVALDFAKPSA